MMDDVNRTEQEHEAAAFREVIKAFQEFPDHGLRFADVVRNIVADFYYARAKRQEEEQANT